MKRIVWTKQETTKLTKLVKQLESADDDKWQIISEMLNVEFNISKSPHQCQKRWKQCHRSNYNKDNQRSEEISKLFNLHLEMGSDWKQISNHLKGRTEIDVKNKFHQSVRKGLRKIYKFYRKAEGTDKLNRIKFVEIYQFLIKLDKNEKRIVYHLIEWFCLANRLQVNEKKLTTQQTILTKLIVEQLIQAYGCLQSQIRKKNKQGFSTIQNNDFQKLYKNLEGYQNMHDRIQQAKIYKRIDMVQKSQIIYGEEQGVDIELYCQQKQDSLLSFYKSERQFENQFQIFQQQQHQGEQQINRLKLGDQNIQNQITNNQVKSSHQIQKQTQIYKYDIEKKKSKHYAGKDAPINTSKKREQKNKSGQQPCGEKRVLLSDLCQDQVEQIRFDLELKQSPLFASFNIMDDQHFQHTI